MELSEWVANETIGRHLLRDRPSKRREEFLALHRKVFNGRIWREEVGLNTSSMMVMMIQ